MRQSYRVERVAPDGSRAAVVTLRCALPALVGQFVTLDVPVETTALRRSYSITSVRPSEIDIIVKRIEGGRASNWLVDHTRPGDLLRGEAPAGSFVLPTIPTESHHLFIGGGSGLSPLIGLIEQHVDGPGSATLIACDRDERQAIGRARLDALLARSPHQLRWLRFIDDGPLDARSERGPLTATRLRDIVRAARPLHSAFLCGPDGLQKMAAAAIAEAPLVEVRQERFVVDARESVPCVIEIAGHPAITARAGQSVIDALDGSGFATESSCRAGQCGSCKLRLRDGLVTLATDEGLTPKQLAEGWILPCVAYARSERISLSVE
jgi:3-ketosteroid 9alpha-monooxygenase subunit B